MAIVKFVTARLPQLFHLLFCFGEVNGADDTGVDSSCELVKIVPDASKLAREFIETFDDNDVFFEYTIPNKIADDAIITVELFLDPHSFLGRDSECNDRTFSVFLIIQMIFILSDNLFPANREILLLLEHMSKMAI